MIISQKNAIILENLPNFSAFGLNLSINNVSSPFFVEFLLENRDIDLFSTTNCPNGTCELCSNANYHYIVTKNTTFTCISPIYNNKNGFSIRKKLKFMEKATENQKNSSNNNSISGYFGLKFLQKLINPSKSLIYINFNENNPLIDMSKTMKNPEITLNLSRNLTILAKSLEISHRIIEKKPVNIAFSFKNDTGFLFPEVIFREIRHFLKYFHIKCRVPLTKSSIKPLYCRVPRNKNSINGKFLNISLENNKILSINLQNTLLKNKSCHSMYCETLISMHKSKEIVLMRQFFEENLVFFNLKTSKISIKSKNATKSSNLFIFSKKMKIPNKSPFIEKKTLLKIAIFFGFFIISLILARIGYKCLYKQIERNLPNYEKSVNTEENESVNSFRAISEEIRNARNALANNSSKNSNISVKSMEYTQKQPKNIGKRAKKPIFQKIEPDFI